ncbi:MAG: hypothetical protein N3E52_06830 [Candidatus Bathyarchaeota archaeon]|nr:hypothetical protein [Candidatus Bathyarchaeota archaeon]
MLQRITELTYPQSKLQIIVIDDASNGDKRLLNLSYSKFGCWESA